MRWGGGGGGGQNQNNYNGKPEVLATCRSIMGRVGGGGTCTPPVSGSSAYATTVFVQSNLGYLNSFVLRILYYVRISEFVQITEVVAKINR